jgi:hypothetical protein
MTRERPTVGTITACAALGSVMAGVAVGALYAISMAAYADSMEVLLALLMLLLVGAITGLIVGTPIGLVVGLAISRQIGTNMGHAALAGALTGATYPILIWVMAFSMEARGLSELASTFAVLAGLGAVCGALAHRWVIGKNPAEAG